MKISIITTVYNNQEHISQAIESVLDQSYPEIEYIVVDGNSSDGTLEIVKSYGNKISKLISEPDRGIYDGLNKGIISATGDVIGFLHSDDFYPNKEVIQQVAQHFDSHCCDALYGDLNYVDKKNTNKITRSWVSGYFSHSLLSKGWMPPHPTLFLKKKIYLSQGLFNTEFKISADYDYMLKLFCASEYHICYLQKVLYSMRTGGTSNKNLKNIYRKSREDLTAIKENNIGNVITLIRKNLSKISQYYK
ncbi:MAG: glycosyltransferase family 2 protein [Thiotrichales bacterium]